MVFSRKHLTATYVNGFLAIAYALIGGPLSNFATPIPVWHSIHFDFASSIAGPGDVLLALLVIRAGIGLTAGLLISNLAFELAMSSSEPWGEGRVTGSYAVGALVAILAYLYLCNHVPHKKAVFWACIACPIADSASWDWFTGVLNMQWFPGEICVKALGVVPTLWFLRRLKLL